MLSPAQLIFCALGAVSWIGPIRRRHLEIGPTRLPAWDKDLLSFLLVIAVTLVTGILVAMCFATQTPSAEDLVASGAAFQLTLAGASFTGLWIFDRNPRFLFLDFGINAKSGAVAVLRMAPIIAVAAWVSAHLLGPINSEALNQLANVKGVSLLIAIATAVIIGPVAEELFCRGLLQRWLASRASTTTSAWISAAIFALIHFDSASVLPLMVVGFTASILAIRSGGLIAPIVFHMLFNLTQLLFTFVA